MIAAMHISDEDEVTSLNLTEENFEKPVKIKASTVILRLDMTGIDSLSSVLINEENN